MAVWGWVHCTINTSATLQEAVTGGYHVMYALNKQGYLIIWITVSHRQASVFVNEYAKSTDNVRDALLRVLTVSAALSGYCSIV